MTSPTAGLFFVWRIFQRRTESLAAEFGLRVNYYYRSWEDRSKFHKACSYVPKAMGTVKDLISNRPAVVFIQLPPTPLLYIAAMYCWMTRTKLIADCHNAMIYSRWLTWPLAKSLLRRTDAVLVHNEDVERYARQYKLKTIVLRDPLPNLPKTTDRPLLEQHGLSETAYVIVPWSFAPDEPISEFIEAVASLPDVKFVMTWFAEKLSPELRSKLPPNLILTGYLDNRNFNAIFSQASAALVLTTREGTQPSAASEAIVLGIPLIVSDLRTTRTLYEEMPIYVDNDAEAIRQGIIEALAENDRYKEKITAFQRTFENRLEAEIRDVKSLLGVSSKDTELR